MKKLYIIVIALFFGTSVFAQVPQLSWGKTIGDVNSDDIISMCTDGDGNLYIAGTFYGTVDFDPGTGDATRSSASVDYWDGFIVKFNAAGQFQWVKTIGGATTDAVYSIATDGTTVYATGIFNGPTAFAPDEADTYEVQSRQNSTDAFIAAYSADTGDIYYAKNIGSDSYDYGYGIAVDINGSIYVTGAFQGTAQFDPDGGTDEGQRTAIGGYDMFLAKYTSGGFLVWANGLGSFDEDSGQAIAVSPDGSKVYVGGYYSGGPFYPDQYNFSTYLTNAGLSDGYIGEFDGSTGNHLWGGYVSTGDYDLIRTISVDGNGIYFGGYFTGTGTVFGDAGTSRSIFSNGASDGFVARLDPTSKQLVWINTFGSVNGYDLVSAVAAPTYGTQGNIYVVGSFVSTMDVDPSANVATLTNSGFAYDAFMIKYNWETGAYVDAASIGSLGSETPEGVCVSPDAVYWGGSFNDGVGDDLDLDFGPNQLLKVSAGETDGFFIRLDHVSPLNPPAGVTFPQVLDDYIEAVFDPGATPPDGYLILFRVGSDPIDKPLDGVVYEHGDVIGTTRVAFPTISTDNGITLLSGTQYHFAIYSYNGSGTGIKYSFDALTDVVTTTGTPADTQGPTIVDKSVKKAALGTDIQIAATVTDATDVSYVKVHFSPLNADQSFYYDMTYNAATSQYEVSIDKQYNKDQGIEYYIDAEDGYGNTNRTPGYTTVLIDFAQGLSIPYSAGSAQTNYRIISVPVNLNSKTVADVFDELGTYDKTKYRLFRYNGTSTTELTGTSAIEPGRGYWFIAAESKTINTGAGTSVNVGFTTPLTIPITNGWNQIGNPYNFDLPWSLVANHADNDDKTFGDFKIYEGSFAVGTTVKKMSGGFVMVQAKGDGNLRLPVFDDSGSRIAAPADFRQTIASDTWAVDLKLKSGSIENNFGGFGMHPQASEQNDKFDDFTLPRFMDYLEVNYNKTLFGSSFTKDIVPSSTQHAWSFEIDSNVPENLIELSWDNAYFGSTDLQLVLWDVEQQRSIDMKSESSYAFQRGQSRAFKVFYGTREYVKAETLPFNAVFHSAWPVPSTGNVTFEFSVPEAGDAKTNLAVYNMMGQKVANVVDQALPAGYQKAVWNIEDGVKPAAGVYISVLKHGNTTLQKRLIIK